ncbi:UNVERIFIED_CONTAM: hypothetical protein NCL1_52514 [Trichonephila clavipes]
MLSTFNYTLLEWKVPEGIWHRLWRNGNTKRVFTKTATVFVTDMRGGGTLNSLRAASSLVRLMEGEEKWEAPVHFQGVLPQNWNGIEPQSFWHLYGAQSYVWNLKV